MSFRAATGAIALHARAARTYGNTLALQKENHVQPVAEDPFAVLYEPQPQSHIYISGRLTLLRVPAWLNPGLWIQFPSHPTNSAWHRRLDSNSFLWLRSAVNHAMDSGKIAPGFEDAPAIMEQIAAIGITEGAFTADEISKHCTAPEWYSFNDGLPTWADEIEPDFLPPVRRNDKAALTTAKR